MNDCRFGVSSEIYPDPILGGEGGGCDTTRDENRGETTSGAGIAQSVEALYRIRNSSANSVN